MSQFESKPGQRANGQKAWLALLVKNGSLSPHHGRTLIRNLDAPRVKNEYNPGTFYVQVYPLADNLGSMGKFIAKYWARKITLPDMTGGYELVQISSDEGLPVFAGWPEAHYAQLVRQRTSPVGTHKKRISVNCRSSQIHAFLELHIFHGGKWDITGGVYRREEDSADTEYLRQDQTFDQKSNGKD